MDDDSETDQDADGPEDAEEENDTVNDQQEKPDGMIVEEEDDIECYSEDQEKNALGRGKAVAAGSAAAPKGFTSRAKATG